MPTSRNWSAVLVLGMVTLLPGSRVLAQAPSESARWHGVYPTVVTPFRGPRGGIDTRALELQVTHELRGGVHGLVVLDTFGEGKYVSPEERDQVVATAVRLAVPRVPVVVGIHSSDLATARAQLLRARDQGAAAALLYYTGKPHASLNDVLTFVATLSTLNVPIFYGHAPHETGLHFGPEAIAHILTLPRVVGIKEAANDLGEVEEHLRCCGRLGKAFFSGCAVNLTEFLERGGHGAMCPEAVLLPGPTVRIYEAFANGRTGEARALQGELQNVTPILHAPSGGTTLTRVVLWTAPEMRMPAGTAPAPAQVKTALTDLGVPTAAWMKGQAPELTAYEEQCVHAAVGRLRKIDWCEVSLRAPPVPTQGRSKREGGMLLRTGAFQLGQGVSKDLLRSQGDGLWGFPID